MADINDENVREIKRLKEVIEQKNTGMIDLNIKNLKYQTNQIVEKMDQGV